VNKNELISEMAKLSGLTKADCDRALGAALQSIEHALAKGDSVRLIGHGTYSVLNRKATVARNPRDGSTINVPASRVPKFKAGKQLKDTVNKKSKK
jgi:DNA-binding protein HU-beta